MQAFQDLYKKNNQNLTYAFCISIGLFGGILLKNTVKKGLDKIGILSKGHWGNVNSTEARILKQKELPRGKNDIQLYYIGTPNGQKAKIMLEELGIDYDSFIIDISKGEQFTSGFVEINPNSKIPAIVDFSENKYKGQRVYETGNILLYLAEKNGGKFLPKDPAQKTECLSLLFMQIGLGPMIGQFGHFNNYAPKGLFFDHSYAWQRYATEVQRIVSVLNNILSEKTYLCGEEYTIADIAWYPWINFIKTVYKSWDRLNLDRFKNVVRWLELLEKRPAIQRGSIADLPWLRKQKEQQKS